MTNFNNLCPIEAVFLEYDFKPFSRMVDVGGGLGAFTAAALTAAPQLQGHLFDLPNVIQQAQEVSTLCPALSYKATGMLLLWVLPIFCRGPLRDSASFLFLLYDIIN